jgi:hypothetical protein
MTLADSVSSTTHLAMWLTLAAVGSLLPPRNVWAAPTPDAATVLKKIRDAVGYSALAEHPGGLLIEGDTEYDGLHGPFSLLFTPQGQFRQKLQLRREHLTTFDGTRGWAVDWSGTPYVLDLADLEFAQSTIWLRTGRWLAEDGPFSISMGDHPADSSEVRLHLRLKHGLRELDVFVDRSTWLPTRMTAHRMGLDEVWEYGDYRSYLGVRLARRVVYRFGKSSEGHETGIYEIGSVRPAPATTDDPFKPVLDLPHDTEFRPTEPVRFPLKSVTGGHLFVRPKINGVDVGWFALDTGTGSGLTISPKLAEQLKLPSFGRVLQGGAGKFGSGKLFEGKTLQLGSMTIRNSIYTELPQAFCDAMKRVFDLELVGTCGYDLFSRAVVEIDLKDLTACCHDPAHYALPGGKWEQLRLNHKISCVYVTYEGERQGLFQFDTGAGNNVLFHAPAVEQLKLLENRKTTSIKVGGVGGTLDARLGQLAWFQVGDRRLEHLTAIFLAPHEGALDDPYVAGTFGAGILKGMKIVFDYPHQRIAFGK